jgi:transposase
MLDEIDWRAAQRQQEEAQRELMAAERAGQEQLAVAEAMTPKVPPQVIELLQPNKELIAAAATLAPKWAEIAQTLAIIKEQISEMHDQAAAVCPHCGRSADEPKNEN